MTRQLIICVVLGATVITGCSNRAVYDNLRLHQRNECRDQPMSSYEKCLERARQSYEAYQRERAEALDQ